MKRLLLALVVVCAASLLAAPVQAGCPGGYGGYGYGYGYRPPVYQPYVYSHYRPYSYYRPSVGLYLNFGGYGHHHHHGHGHYHH
ncbi:MAG: hypothetical protein RIC55_16525 [Pirellulaceae bacterium]